MKKLIIKLISWFKREDEAKKLYRIAKYLLRKYKIDPEYIHTSVTTHDHKRTTGSFYTVYHITIMSPDIRTNTVEDYAKDFNLVVEMFELKLKEWKNGEQHQ